MRRLLADLAFGRAVRCLVRSDLALTLRSHLYWRARSAFWSDAECYFAGLGTWRELRASRARRQRLARPFVDILMEGPGL